MSYVLRHAPQSFGLKLERGGWVNVDSLLCALSARGRPVSRDELLDIVRNDEKQRFSLSQGDVSIRANQGHSVDIELDLESIPPPASLYHGSVERYWPAIARDGLRRGARHHVHLSATVELAEQVGARRGAPLVLEVRARDMESDGYAFFRAANGVWLTEHVPPAYLRRHLKNP